MIHKEGRSKDHAAVAWRIPLTADQLAINANPDTSRKIPSNKRELITGRYLTSFVPDPGDLDDDGFLDSWEQANGLDPTRYNAPTGDADGDGLSDFEEWQWGTAANLADSDGDGVSDFDEIHLLETDAMLADVKPFIPVQTLPGASGIPAAGDWAAQGDRLVQRSPDGAAMYSFHVQTAGIFLVEVDLTPVTAGPSDEWEIELRIDNQFAGRRSIQLTSGTQTTFKALSPWLPRGTHEVEIVIHNVYVTRRLAIEAVRLLRTDGTDADGNGIADWVGERLAAHNAVAVTDESITSPFYLEGRTHVIEGCSNKENLPVHPGPNQAFFIEMPLKAGKSSPLNLSLENGAVRHRFNVKWTPFNLLYEDDLVLRVGESLRLTAAPEGAGGGNMVLGIGTQLVERAWNKPKTVLFDHPGETILTGIYQGPDHSASGAVRVIAVEADLGEAPVLIAGKFRTWTFPILDSLSELEFDDALQVSAGQATATDQSVQLFSSTPGISHIAARIVGNGAILDALSIETISFHKGDDTGVRYVEFYEDGSQLVEMPIHISNMTPDMRVELDIFVAGVIFENGSTRMVLTAADFDANGWARVRFLRPDWVTASVCHRTRIYQGDQQIAYFR